MPAVRGMPNKSTRPARRMEDNGKPLKTGAWVLAELGLSQTGGCGVCVIIPHAKASWRAALTPGAAIAPVIYQRSAAQIFWASRKRSSGRNYKGRTMRRPQYCTPDNRSDQLSDPHSALASLDSKRRTSGSKIQPWSSCDDARRTARVLVSKPATSTRNGPQARG